MPPVLLALASSAEKEPLTKALCELLEFCISFDQIKMMRPTIQNEFSFYRRAAAKMRNSGLDDVSLMDDSTAAMISMYVAEATPMLMAATKAAKAALEQNKQVAEAIAIIANSCCKMMASKTLETQSQSLCLYAMTGAILLYDLSLIHI